MRQIGHWVLTMALIATAAGAQTKSTKPAVPPGAPTRGLAVALITPGIDYTNAAVAARLARDGEGEMIGWDTLDRDRRPYSSDPEATRAAALAPVLIMPVRIDPAQTQTLVEAIEFIKRTPARVVVIPFTLREGPATASVAAAIDAAKDLLFVLAAGDDGVDLDVAPQAFASTKRDHVIVVSALAPSEQTAKPNRGARSVDVIVVPATAAREAPGGGAMPPTTSGEAAILFAGQFICAAKDLARAISPADVKRILVGQATRDTRQPTPLLETCARAAPRR